MRSKNVLTKKIISSLFIMLFFTLSLHAEKIFFSAASMTGQTGDNKRNTTKLIGEAYVKTETMEIYADSIELSGEDYRKIIAEGNIKGKNIEAKMDFTCSYLEYDRQTKIALLKGDVSLTDLENDVKAQAQIIEYNQNTQIAVLQVQIKLLQKNNTCTGSYAIYQKKAQLLDISGNAQVRQGEDLFRAQSISLNLDTQEIELLGNVQGTVTQKNEEKSEEKNTEKKENPEEQKTDAEAGGGN